MRRQGEARTLPGCGSAAAWHREEGCRQNCHRACTIAHRYADHRSRHDSTPMAPCHHGLRSP
eukprot:8311652-Heterocapsa_arctica.AAC.1